MVKEWSSQQKDVFNAFRSTSKNLLISATAGAGKSTLLIELTKIFGSSVRLVAFNNSIVKELTEKMPSNAKASTMHSMGMGSLIKVHGNININAKKTSKYIAINLSEGGIWSEYEGNKGRLFMALPPLYNAYRVHLCSNKEDLKFAAYGMGLGFDDEELDMTMELVDQIGRENELHLSEVDFTDMIYLPATDRRYKMPRAGLWLIDEVQDLNKAQLKLMKRAAGRNRVVMVGDPCQSINGFCGADTSMFNKLRKWPNIQEMPLTLTYRCPLKVTLHAQSLYKTIECPSSVIEGSVKRGDVMDAQPGDLVICRNSKPLVKVFLKYLKAKQPCYIKGGEEIGNKLKSIIKPHLGKSTSDMLDSLFDGLNTLMDNLVSGGVTNPRKHPKYINEEELVDIIEIISPNYNSASQVMDSLNQIFKERGVGVCLLTGHKSKGMEAKNIYFLDSHLIPSKYAETEDQKLQEKNLKFVIITRSKENLLYCLS